MSLNEDIIAALEAWGDIAELDAPRAIKLFSYNFEPHTWLKELNEATEQDPSFITTAAILVAVYDEWSKNAQLSVGSLISRDPMALQKLEQYQHLAECLNAPSIKEVIEDYRQAIIRATANIGMELEGKHTEAPYLGLLRRDAFNSFNKLKAFQFLQGQPLDNSFGLNKWVLQFPNVNSLIEGIVQSGHHGVSMVMIKDDFTEAYNYFCFAIWNGGTLTILTDRTDWSHPIAKHLQAERGTGRQLEERWGKHHFPYYLMDMDWSPNTKHVHARSREGLVRYQQVGMKMKLLSELHPSTTMWALMIYEMIREKYGRENFLLPECSYTSEVVQKQLPVTTALALRDEWEPVVLDDIAIKDLTPEKTKNNWVTKWGNGRGGHVNKQTGFNDWLEDRYRDQIDESMLNLVKNDEGELLLGDNPSEMALALVGGERGLRAMTPTDFGTVEDLKADQEWAARYNQALAVNKLAREECEREGPNMKKWFEERVLANRKVLIDDAAAVNMTIKRIVYNRSFGSLNEEAANDGENIVRLYVTKPGYIPNCCNSTVVAEREYHHYRGSTWFCPITDAKTTLCAVFRIECPQDIAAVCGCEVDDLPLFLQHYAMREPYSGNHLLDRVDPMEWVVTNQWGGTYGQFHNLEVRVPFSKRGINMRRKELGLSRITDWENIRKDNLW